MLRVKVCNNTGDIRSQCPASQEWGGNVRFVFDRESRAYDWLVVYSDFPQQQGQFFRESELLACHPDNTLLLTHEPSCVKRYGNAFTRQFKWVFSCHGPILKHPGLLASHPASPWCYRKTYEEFKSGTAPEKSGMLSTCCSLKNMSYTLHQDRVRFTRRLKAKMPELALFGELGSYVDDKRDALEPYKYHLAVENHVGANHWTEKITDAFLAFCLPIYFGCPNIHEYFPEESLVVVDIFDFEGAVETIRKVIADNEYERRLAYVKEARSKALEEHNICNVIAKFVEKHHTTGNLPKRMTRIYSHRHLTIIRPVYAVSHTCGKILQRVRHYRNYQEMRKGSGLYG